MYFADIQLCMGGGAGITAKQCGSRGIGQLVAHGIQYSLKYVATISSKTLSFNFYILYLYCINKYIFILPATKKQRQTPSDN